MIRETSVQPISAATRLKTFGWSGALLLAALGAAAALRCSDTAPPAPEPNGRPQHLPTATIRVGDLLLVVEVADQEPERKRGMMFRRRLGPDEAMLFVFPRETDTPFWMANCYVDLDLAYIRADGTIMQIEHMKAHNRESVWSREPYCFALEVPAGWFEVHGIKVGETVEIPEDVAASTQPPHP
ncbi:MAG TPA: DUF192 domain-containing protein [Phycisphaerae bacterium]|nr:DUF192 domain-containing protein [Phycisphaerae bacterium]HUS44845.1 DUF192 domain-containing protein [Phycisphaerae bacterium]